MRTTSTTLVIFTAWLPFALGTCDVEGTGSRGATAASPELEVAPVLSKLRTIALQSDTADPLGFMSDIAVWNGAMAVTDGFLSRVRMFDTEGRMLRTFGRVGEGPGELRGAASLMRDRDGSILVLDREGRLSRFTEDGEYVSRVQMPGVKSRSVEPTDRRGLYLVAARFRKQNRQYGLMLVDSSGVVHRAIHPLPARIDEQYRSNFLNVRGVETENYFVSMDQTQNIIQRHDKSGDGTTNIIIDADWYAPPAWPSEDIGDLPRITEWANVQMWGLVLEHVSGDQVLVGFARPRGRRGDPEHYYVIVDVQSGRQRVAPSPMIGLVRAVRDGTAYIPRINDQGRELVHLYALHTVEPRTALRDDPTQGERP